MIFETSENFATGVMLHFDETEQMILKLNVCKAKKLSSPPMLKKPPIREPRGCKVQGEHRYALVLMGTFDNIVPSKLRDTMDTIRNFVLEKLKEKWHCPQGKGYEAVTEFRIWFNVNVKNMCLELSFYMEATPEFGESLTAG